MARISESIVSRIFPEDARKGWLADTFFYAGHSERCRAIHVREEATGLYRRITQAMPDLMGEKSSMLRSALLGVACLKLFFEHLSQGVLVI